MSAILKQKILDKLDAIEFSTEEENNNADKGTQAIIDALIDYISNDFTPITGVVVGIDATAPSPTPVGGSSTHNLLVQSGTWFDTWKGTINTGVDVGTTIRMFTALQTMITGTISLSLETAGAVTVIAPPPDPVIASPVTFPAMASFGSVCEAELLKTKGDRDTSWGIVAKYIHKGLNINVAPPIILSGTLISSVTGTATPLPVSFL